MFALERQQRILELLAQNGAVWVSKLSEDMGVTEETVRRDLEKLEKKEALRRTHGGALPIDESSYDLSLSKRKVTNVEAKERLAKEAVRHIATGDTVFLDASTTTFYMAKELKKMSQVTVITNSLRVISELTDHESIKLIAIGGIVSQNQSFVGRLAERSIQNDYFANKMFFSSKGVTLDAGILESNEQECAIKQQMIENAMERYYLCDSSKIGRIGFVKLAPLDKMNHFLTEATLSEDWLSRFQEDKINVIQA